MMRRW